MRLSHIMLYSALYGSVYLKFVNMKHFIVLLRRLEDHEKAWVAMKQGEVAIILDTCEKNNRLAFQVTIDGAASCFPCTSAFYSALASGSSSTLV